MELTATYRELGSYIKDRFGQPEFISIQYKVWSMEGRLRGRARYKAQGLAVRMTALHNRDARLDCVRREER